MLGKCAETNEAQRVFNALNKQDINVVTWTAMLQVFAEQGDAKEATRLFNEMQKYVKVNDITSVSLLTALSHAHQASEAKTFVETMQSKFHIVPNIMHYNCVVDALSRVGKVQEAEEYITQYIPSPTIGMMHWVYTNASASYVDIIACWMRLGW
jgi:pentatricopeptide repeat protein